MQAEKSDFFNENKDLALFFHTALREKMNEIKGLGKKMNVDCEDCSILAPLLLLGGLSKACLQRKPVGTG
jgi:hypothetical protein